MKSDLRAARIVKTEKSPEAATTVIDLVAAPCMGVDATKKAPIRRTIMTIISNSITATKQLVSKGNVGDRSEGKSTAVKKKKKRKRSDVSSSATAG